MFIWQRIYYFVIYAATTPLLTRNLKQGGKIQLFPDPTFDKRPFKLQESHL